MNSIKVHYKGYLSNIILYIINTITKEYDISIDIINEIINNDEVYNIFNLLNDKILSNDINLSPMSLDINYIDRCSHKTKVHKNSYVEYCNTHKYIHDDIKSHDFVPFSKENISKLSYQLEIYQKFVKKNEQIYNKLYYIFVKILNEYSSLEIFKVDNIKELITWLSEDSKRFRDKKIYKNDDEKFIKCYKWNGITDSIYEFI